MIQCLYGISFYIQVDEKIISGRPLSVNLNSPGTPILLQYIWDNA
jgi:hypothetical protein